MPIDLKKIKAGKNILPPRIVIYGPPKIGKTTLAASIPNNLLMDYEGGSGFTEVARLEKDQVDTYDKTMSAISDLYSQEHNFQTLTIDTADWLEAVVNEKVAKDHQVATVADIPYGAGFVTAQNIFKNEILEGLDALRREKGMMIIMLAHECIRRYDNPTTESYDRYTLKLQENTKGAGICAVLKEWSDAILFANQETFVKKEAVGSVKGKQVKKAMTTNNIILHTQESPAFLAGNRLGLPPTIPFAWSALSEALTTALS